MACLSANDAFAKALTASYSPLQILFLRNVIALPVTIVIALILGGLSPDVRRDPLYSGLTCSQVSRQQALLFMLSRRRVKRSVTEQV
ncbi:hypothetical protein [Thioclava sp. DLFJ4-1]|uniref:hypothetical protein n=1 Tax=Thioclava sp. DLFJ4-1 TaxID=1915313 RepID=UPI001AEFE122|nr:hypothetical protein [Thioclava sp. DLFJ4-1]